MNDRRVTTWLVTALTLFMLLIILACIACDDSTTAISAGNTTWLIRPGSMSLAVLVSDYQTGIFEEGTISYYHTCRDCAEDGLPFSIRFNPPGDFGDISFSYTETGDTLFYGTIIWMGTGRIRYPASFTPAGEFTEMEDPPGEPVSIEYFNILPKLDEETFKTRAAQAWEGVKYLDIVGEFAKGKYRVGIYLYAPAVGVFVPELAKWIIFLHRQKEIPLP